MRITRCDRCGREYDPKELEPAKIRYMDVNRIRIGTNTGISDSTDLCQECINEFKEWWERYSEPEEVPELLKKGFNFPDTICLVTEETCIRCTPGPCRNRKQSNIVAIKTEE